MYETAYNTINERIAQLTNTNLNVVAQFQPPKINFINDTPVRKPDGSPDPKSVSSIHCAYAVKRVGLDTGTSVHLYFTQLADKINYRVYTYRVQKPRRLGGRSTCRLQGVRLRSRQVHERESQLALASLGRASVRPSFSPTPT